MGNLVSPLEAKKRKRKKEKRVYGSISITGGDRGGGDCITQCQKKQKFWSVRRTRCGSEREQAWDARVDAGARPGS